MQHTRLLRCSTPWNLLPCLLNLPIKYFPGENFENISHGLTRCGKIQFLEVHNVMLQQSSTLTNRQSLIASSHCLAMTCSNRRNEYGDTSVKITAPSWQHILHREPQKLCSLALFPTRLNGQDIECQEHTQNSFLQG
jgi:hypothetical protein